MSEYKIVALPTSLVPVLWDKMIPHLQKAIEISNGELTEEGVKGALVSGNQMALLICREESVVAVHTLEIKELSEGLRVLHINAIGGDEMDSWFEQYVLVMRAIAKDLNCTEVRGCAVRDGWLKYLKSTGFEKISSTVRLKLGE
jgi:hypothetical protein